jgi:hypothetical protein
MSGFSFFGISSLRHNKRKRINKLDRIEPYIGAEFSKPTYKKAPKGVLQKIKVRMQKQNRESRRNTIIIFSIVGCIVVASMYYFLFIL